VIRALALLLGLAAAPLAAEEIVLGLSQDEVAITATFDGDDILVFGAVKRSAPDPGGLDVVIAVSGPLLPATVREAERRFGIWINTASAAIDAAPSYYAVATSAPLAEILSETEDLRQSITLPRVIRSVGTGVDSPADFTDALIRIRAGEGLYSLTEGAVDFEQDTLFRTGFALPANLIEGNYTIRIFLLRGGSVVDRYDTVLAVQKVGLERWLYNLSQELPAAYGVLSLALAIAAGWLASAAFARTRR